MIPTADEANQLCRLRALRVKRAEERQNEAKAVVQRALAIVCARQAAVAATLKRLDELAYSIVHELAENMPRWASLAAAERDRVDDRLERDRVALRDEEKQLDEANIKLYQARQELARARARENVVQDLAKQADRLRARTREQRAERELEDRSVRAVA